MKPKKRATKTCWGLSPGAPETACYMALNIGAMLIAFLALVALVDGIFGGIHRHIAWFPVSLESVLGVLFSPVAWVIGIPWRDCPAIGNLLGTRMVLNELVAFSMLGPQRAALDPRARLRSRHLLFAALQILVRLESRSAASVLWPRIKKENSHDWGSVPCSRAPWPTLCQLRLPACCYKILLTQSLLHEDPVETILRCG